MGVLDIVPGVAHDRDRRVLPGRQLVVADELDGLGLDHGLLRVDGQVQQSIDAVQLVEADSADGLLAHSALIGISG